LEKRLLVDGLVACGLLKADADWDEKHPRTGAPPNPGWFAPTEGPQRTRQRQSRAARRALRRATQGSPLLPRRRRSASVPCSRKTCR
jgi:hypothetical protein